MSHDIREGITFWLQLQKCHRKAHLKKKKKDKWDSMKLKVCAQQGRANSMDKKILANCTSDKD